MSPVHTGVVVTIEHVRAELLCVRGVRRWFDARGLDFAAFLREGCPAEQLEALADDFATRVAARARLEAADGL